MPSIPSGRRPLLPTVCLRIQGRRKGAEEGKIGFKKLSWGVVGMFSSPVQRTMRYPMKKTSPPLQLLYWAAFFLHHVASSYGQIPLFLSHLPPCPFPSFSVVLSFRRRSNVLCLKGLSCLFFSLRRRPLVRFCSLHRGIFFTAFPRFLVENNDQCRREHSREFGIADITVMSPPSILACEH